MRRIGSRMRHFDSLLALRDMPFRSDRGEEVDGEGEDVECEDEGDYWIIS